MKQIYKTTLKIDKTQSLKILNPATCNNFLRRKRYLYHNLLNCQNEFCLMWTRLSTTITVTPGCTNKLSPINAFGGMILTKIDGAKRVCECRGEKILLGTLNPNTQSSVSNENYISEMCKCVLVVLLVMIATHHQRTSICGCT